ncbi:MAG: ATP-binding cassette domain-containing protein [Pirellula sp.]
MFPNFWPPSSGLRTPGSAWIASFLAMVLALLVPALLLLGGFAIDLMGWEHQRVEQSYEQGSPVLIDTASQTTSIGPFRFPYSNLPFWNLLSSFKALGLIGLLGIGLALMSLLNWLQRRAGVQSALDTEEQVHQRLFHHSGALAIERGLSAQAGLLQSFHEQTIPAMRMGIINWLQVYPKHFLQLGVLVLSALLIHPRLTIAALIAAWIVRNVYLWQQAGQIKQRWVEQQRWAAAHEQLGAVAQTAPLMATIHDSRETLDHYRSNMMTYRNAASEVLGIDKAKLPLVPLSLAAFGTGLVFLLALGMLDPLKHLSIGAGFVWTASICAAIYSGYRIASARFSVSKATPKLAQIHQYLGIQAKPTSPATKTLAKKLTQGVSAEHVTLQAGNNQKLLDDVSAAFKPGQLTAIISSDPFLSKALVEMILGFGQPVSGRLMFDEVDSKDLSSESIRQHCLWIAPNGPLVTGTIEDNLWLGLQRDATVDLREITQLARVSEAVLELPDGLQTLVSVNEQRLSPDLMFRLGIARAFLKKPSIIVAEEPLGSQAGIEAETTRALIEARNHSCIVLVLPNRLSTLRAADQVVVLHNRKVADVGTHSELLERSELYRHWNYVHFAPVMK